jgi:predicted Zn-dependent peptidase
MYRVTTLPNGLRVATLSMPQVESVSVGLWIGVGGRYEPPALSGISHFIEHLMFKGTRRRTAREISESVESIGGYMNAFTSEETTCLFAKAAHNHLERLTDVLADTYLNSVFVPAEIEKERGVIKDEILMYHDQPSQYVHELLGQTMWPDHPLGRSLTGTIETVQRLSRAGVLDFKRQKYLAPNTVLAIAGHCWHDDAVELATEFFGAMPKTRTLPRFEPCRARNRPSKPSSRSARLLTRVITKTVTRCASSVSSSAKA